MPGIRLELPIIIGLDCAGEIEAIGPGVAGWSIGDRVLIDPRNRVEGGLLGETSNGGLGEFCRARAHQLLRIPDSLSFIDAAPLPCAYGSALRMMYTIGNVSRGERVLILGASGGVGVCCVQLAKMAGASVIACAGSKEKAARLRDLGADHTINYLEQDFVKEVFALYGKPARRGSGTSQGVDVVVNYTGGDTWVKSLRCLRVGGRLLTCGATAGFDPIEDLRYIWTFELKILGSNSWDREDLNQVLDLAQRGELKVVVGETHPMESAVEALRKMETRQVFGKIVVTP
jgi:alcohol dehydrogenase